MKTRVYIDGYNLYYGCLKKTPYKWLDLVKSFENHILPQSTPPHCTASNVNIKYFTSDIKEKASFDTTSVADQNAYHRALEASYPEQKLEIIKGYFSIADEFAFLIDKFEPKTHPKHCERVKVWKLEEKQTDVNIAIHGLFDVLTDDTLEQIVFVTNDTDLAPVLKMISETNKVVIGIVVPINDKNDRPASTMLTDHSDWFAPNINTDSLRKAALPRVIYESVRQSKLRKSIVKPESWFGEKETVKHIMAVLGAVFTSPHARWQWLESEKPVVEGLPILNKIPSELLDNEQDALDVLLHAKCYVDYIKTKKVDSIK
jgi:uncharacterized LabA/DUF88 family protein